MSMHKKKKTAENDTNGNRSTSTKETTEVNRLGKAVDSVMVI